MKPLNLDNSPCSPISSNCVIWQGPNIPCIKLCTGDTITDVVYELATQLCTILDQVNISTLDLSCLDITTGTPTNINQLLQILIDKICELNNVPTPSAFPTRGNSSCPTDCIVPVAVCLQTGGQTTMKLLDYVQLISNTVCSILTSISVINNSITDLTTRVTALESVPPTPPYILPPVTPECTLADGSVEGGVSYPLDIVLTALINDNNHGYCALLGATGQPSEIVDAYNLQTVDGTDGALSNCALTLDQLFSATWITTPTNLSESFIDLWLTVQDIRDAYKRYNVTAGNSNVTVTTTTTPGTCGPEVSFAVKAKSASVVAGANVTVTSVETGDNTAYTVNASQAKGVLVTDTSSVNLTVTSDANNFTINARVNDTGWVNLEGFNWFVDTPTWRPQCRRIGNVVHFRGTLMVPLTGSTGDVVNYTYGGSPRDSYAEEIGVTPYSGTGGVYVDNDGAIYFNNNTPVIPSSVVDNATTFDQSIFSSNYVVASRYIRYKTATGALSTFTGILHAVCKIFIYSHKGMALQILRDNEYSAAGGTGNPIGTSPLNSLVSRVTLNELTPRWYQTNTGVTGTFTDFHSSPTSGSGTQEVFYADDLRFPFTCDAGQPINLGGFGWVQLEGMTATLAPCNTDIKNVNC